MSLIYCPECGSRVSDAALACPHCGYSSNQGGALIKLGSLPPASRKTFIQIPEASIFDNGTYAQAEKENSVLVDLFKNAEKLQEFAPALYDAIQKIMQKRGSIWAADFSEAAEKLMESGELVLGREKKTGRILPQLREKKTQHVYKTARLKKQDLPTDVASSLATLQLQVSLAELMGEIKNVAENVEALRLEAQGDRIGRTKAVWERLNQAVKIKDARLREQKILAIADSATEQRCIMQEHFERRALYAESKNGKNQDRGRAACDAIGDLTCISLMARSEYAAFSILGEDEAAKSALIQLSSFMMQNKLNSRDRMLRLNSKSKENLEDVAQGFCQIAKKLSNMQLEEAQKEEPAALPKPKEEVDDE